MVLQPPRKEGPDNQETPRTDDRGTSLGPLPPAIDPRRKFDHSEANLAKTAKTKRDDL